MESTKIYGNIEISYSELCRRFDKPTIMNDIIIWFCNYNSNKIMYISGDIESKQNRLQKCIFNLHGSDPDIISYIREIFPTVNIIDQTEKKYGPNKKWSAFDLKEFFIKQNNSDRWDDFITIANHDNITDMILLCQDIANFLNMKNIDLPIIGDFLKTTNGHLSIDPLTWMEQWENYESPFEYMLACIENLMKYGEKKENDINLRFIVKSDGENILKQEATLLITQGYVVFPSEKITGEMKFVGYVSTTYSELKRKFGRPIRDTEDGNCVWILKLDNDSFCHIFDHKTTEIPRSKYDWYIAGKDFTTVEKIAKIVGGEAKNILY